MGKEARANPLANGTLTPVCALYRSSTGQWAIEKQAGVKTSDLVDCLWSILGLAIERNKQEIEASKPLVEVPPFHIPPDLLGRG